MGANNIAAALAAIQAPDGAKGESAMAWKKDESGNLALDNGNPIWTADGGQERAVDYEAMSRGLSEANREAQERRLKLDALEKRYALFKDMEDPAAFKREADKAIEFRKNASDKEKDAEAQYQARLEAARAPDRARIAELEKALDAQGGELRRLKINADIQGSKVLGTFRPEHREDYIEILANRAEMDDEGRIFYRDRDGKAIYGEKGYADAGAAALWIIGKERGRNVKDYIMSDDMSQGSNGSPLPGGGSGPANPWKKDSYNVTEQIRITQKDAALAARLMREAGAA